MSLFFVHLYSIPFISFFTLCTTTSHIFHSYCVPLILSFLWDYCRVVRLPTAPVTWFGRAVGIYSRCRV